MIGPVVVLGGGGFIGSHLVTALVAQGAKVTAVDLGFPDARLGLLDGAALWEADLGEREHALDVVEGAGTVFHLAADMGGVGYFHSDADLGAAMRNGRMTINVVEACRRAEVKRLVYASSACAYPVERAGGEFAEEELGTGTPDQLYGAEKLHGMRIVEKAGGRTVVLDTIYGPGAEREGPRAKFPASVAWKALQARETGRLEMWGDGTQERRVLYVGDAVRRILAVAGAVHYSGPVNITGAASHSLRWYAELCLILAGAEAEIVTNPDRPTGVAARACSGAKFDRLHGPATEVPPEEGFALLMDWLGR